MDSEEVEDDSVIRRSSRVSTKTEQGNAYEMEVLGKRVQQLSKSIHKKIESLDDSRSSREQLKNDIQHIDTLLNELGTITGRLNNLKDSHGLLNMIKDIEFAVATAKLGALQISNPEEEHLYQPNLLPDVSNKIPENVHTLDYSLVGQIEPKDGTDAEMPPTALLLSNENVHKPGTSPVGQTVLKDSAEAMISSLLDKSHPFDEQTELKSPVQALSQPSKLSVTSANRGNVNCQFNRLLKQMNHLEMVLLTEDAELIKKEMAKLDCDMSDLVDANERWVELLDQVEGPKQRIWLEGIDNDVFALKEKVCTWLIENGKRESQASHSNRSSQSSHSSSSKKSHSSSGKSQATHSNRSSRSSHSSGSKNSRLSSEKSNKRGGAPTQLRAKVASLKAEVDFLEKTMASEAQAQAKRKEEEIKAKLEKIRLQIARTEASERVYKADDILNSATATKGFIPQVLQRSQSDKSLDSLHSSGSMKNCLSSKKANQQGAAPIHLKAKAAGLKVEANYLEKNIVTQVQAEANRKEEETKSKLAKLRLQISRTEASERVYEADDVLNLAIKHTMTQEQAPSATKLSTKTLTQSQAENRNEDLSDIIRLIKAPSVDIDVFSGDPLEYEYFTSNFKEVVETTVLDQRGRLMRLIKYTSGKAKNLIKHCIHEQHFCYDMAMQLLEKEYGNAEIIAESYLRQLREWPNLRISDTGKFKELYWFLLKCQMYKRKGTLCELDSSSVIRSIVLKLHSSYHDKWIRKAEEIKRTQSRKVNFDDFVNFVDFHSSCVNSASFSSEIMNEEKRSQIKTNAIKHKPGEKVPCCYICKGKMHGLEDCITYTSRSLVDRKQLLRDSKLCFACLEPISKDHYSKVCRNKITCNTCQKPHPTSLHDPSKVKTETSNSDTKMKADLKSSAVHHTSGTGNVISMCIVPVYISHRSRPDRELLCYVMLDNDCTGCLAIPELLTALAPDELRKAHVTVETVNGLNEEDNAFALDGLIVRSFSTETSSCSVSLPTTFSSNQIPATSDEIPTPDNVCHWKHLSKVCNDLPEYMKHIKIGMIIGGNCPKANEPLEVIPSKNSGPFAYKTRLGWCVVGPIGSSNPESTGNSSSAIQCHFTRLHFTRLHFTSHW